LNDDDSVEITLGLEPGAEPDVEPDDVIHAVIAALDRLDVKRCHLGVEFVGEQRIRELNREHRERDTATDVLSFPVDGEGVAAGQPAPDVEELELGDVVICPAHTADVIEAVVHGVLHLCGFDHETDDGEMLELQDAIVAELRS
jgi:probable rRNA maturation factor